MQFRLDVTAAAGGWDVTVQDVAAGQALRDGNGVTFARHLVPLGGSPPYPIPAAGTGTTVTGPDDDLVTAASPAVLRKVHEDIVARSQGAGLKRFGRYLFETLIGGDVWAAVLRAAGSQPIELALSWKPGEFVFNRLPWELVHDGTRFLAQTPGVAILRRVAGAPQAMRMLQSPPRVLFVVGTELYKDVIEPGAEYLRLLQALRAQNIDLSLRTLLVLKCTSPRLLAALEEFHPDVVHFICHGRLDPTGKGYLELVDQKNTARTESLYSTALVSMLQGLKAPPPIVVLSACYTASPEFTDVGQVAVPFAADLVQNGVPIVVGMSGRIADQACRLFTRQFYESLLTGGDIAHATAEGRRAAISHGGTDPLTAVDWAQPVIFFADGVQDTTLSVALQTEEQTWQGFAQEFRNAEDPVFCDRLEIMEQFDILMAPEAAQRRVADRKSDLQGLAIEVRKPDSGARYGRTWLLHELAVKAIQDGHVPCLVCEGESWRKDVDDLPGNGDQLLRAIQTSVQNTRYRFGLSITATACPLLETLLGLPEGAPLPAGLPAEIHAIGGEPATRPARRKAVALRLDLLALLDEAAAKRPADQVAATKLVLLVDDLHRMGHHAVADFLEHFCGTLGLRNAQKRVRYAFTYSSEPITGQELSVKAVTDARRTWMAGIELGPFKPVLEERHAYQHYLLHWRSNGTLRPLVVETADAVLAKWVFDTLTVEVGGIPSNLLLKAPPIIRAAMSYPKGTVLRDADDESALTLARGDVR